MIFFFCGPLDNVKLIYCVSGFALQFLQFLVCVIPIESFLAAIFKPFCVLKVRNMLSKIDLIDPNAKLESAFGPAIRVASPISGQEPTIIRYGSQARNVLHQQPIETSNSLLVQVQQQSISTTSVSPLPPYVQTPNDSVSPPPYCIESTSYEYSRSEKSQFDIKK